MIRPPQAGDDVVVSGILTRRWGKVARGARFDTEVVIRANHIRLNNIAAPTGILNEGVRYVPLGYISPHHALCFELSSSDMQAEFHAFWAENAECPMNGRNIIVRSVCPQVFGLYLVKVRILPCGYALSAHSKSH